MKTKESKYIYIISSIWYIMIYKKYPEVKERGYTYIKAILPIKALVEIYRRKLKEE